MLKLCVAVLLIAAASAQLSGVFSWWTCRHYRDRNCDHDSEHLECGTDGVTYRNRCEFTKERCSGTHIDLEFYGNCTDPPKGHTGGQPVLSGTAAVLDYFCVELSHEGCPANTKTEIVCGSNGKTYDNLCEYEKGRCTHRDLHVKSFGACST